MIMPAAKTSHGGRLETRKTIEKLEESLPEQESRSDRHHFSSILANYSLKLRKNPRMNWWKLL
jgi:hypothetical protein